MSFPASFPLILTDGPLGSAEITTTFEAFMADNAEGLEPGEVADIEATLARGATYFADQGAGGLWTLRPGPDAPTLSPDAGLDPRLAKFVTGHLLIASNKAPDAAARHLEGWANWANDQLELLTRGGSLPRHLVGINAIDLATARDRLAAAIPAVAA